MNDENNPFGDMGFGMSDLFGNPQSMQEQSEAIELATNLMEAGEAVNELIEYTEENDIDLENMTQSDLQELEYEDMIVMFGFMSFVEGISSMAEMFDDDDDNPFKVSDGDDPIR